MLKIIEELEMTEDEFNDTYIIGTKINYYPIAGEDAHLKTTTRTPAWTLPNGEVIVSIVGRSGGVSLKHITIRKD